ncbi:hypothetical protein TRFO_06215 [Tritrichomonas foetus]|uniref:Leucine Rich Repeat family protein n=1 Tax=Tritrichomonas foetus TaxID=1144522 RepID=A0A1J4K023_9EUKA|nr:hypothetical protein TRFO_06215 [Tritrichomonas foetus]|eukprot:OHT04769.1 hypothetical protein TRFO_06215 [Tritrichomonas foetus]
MDSLIVIDLEENKISDLTNIEFLSTCSNLKSLTLSGNPCVDDPEEYRTKVKGLLPNLLYLDEKRLKPKTPKSGVVGPSPRTTRIRNEISYKAPRRGRKDISDSNAGEEKQASEHASEPVDEKDKESIKEPVKQIRPPEQAKQKRVKIRTPEPANVVQSHNSTKSNSSVPIRPPNEIKIKEPEYDGDDEVIITEMLDDIIEDRPPTSRGNYESKFFKDSFELPAKNKSSKGFKNKPHVITPRVPRGNKPVRPVSAANKM